MVLPIVTSHAVLLSRTLLYTALTRARLVVILVGQTKALIFGGAKLAPDAAADCPGRRVGWIDSFRVDAQWSRAGRTYAL